MTEQYGTIGVHLLAWKGAGLFSGDLIAICRRVGICVYAGGGRDG